MGHSAARRTPDSGAHAPSDDVHDEPSNPGAALEREWHFLAAWEDRRIPSLSAYFRVRQFRRALAASGVD